MKVYRAKHKETGKMLKSSEGRTTWMQKSHIERTREWIEHKDQYEIIEYTLVESKEYEKYKEFINKSFMDRNGFKVF